MYIAGPYAAPTVAETCRNINRACYVGRIALARGLAPMVVHAMIPHLFGLTETPATRQAGIAWSMALLELVAREDGKLWVIELDDGSLSPGTRAEVIAWERLSPHIGRRARWAGWRMAGEQMGIEVPKEAE